jgi:hypothetical protein
MRGLDAFGVIAHTIGADKPTRRSHDMTANYIVRTRDVDGSGTNRYKTLEGAVKRFIEMAGGTIDGHIVEAHHELEARGERLPKIEELRHLRAVSMFGTVVTFEAVSEQAIAAAATARATAQAAAVKPAPFQSREPAALALACIDEDIPF